MQESIVLYPASAFHHLVSMVELGKLILQHHPNFAITILVTNTPFNTSAGASYQCLITQTQTNFPINFHSLALVYLPEKASHMALVFEFMHLLVPKVVEALKTISLSSKVVAFITSAVQDCYDPLIPTYYYFTSGSSALATMLYLPSMHNQTTKSFKDLDDDQTLVLQVPGLPLMKPSSLPEFVLDRHDEAYKEFLNFGSNLPKSRGIIMNTFELLEAKAIRAIVDGDCVPNGSTSPLYCIGPLIVDAEERAGGKLGDHGLSKCLTWLDAQPRQSVVLLCFGSKGAFPVAQLEEIAVGLERSKQRFLWVVKNPAEEVEVESILPQGFLKRSKNIGLVIKGWAPQAAILRHESVGGFVTHCGWNSVMEAVSNGVPMVAWPLYAEQRLNAVVLVEEMKLAIAIAIPIDEEIVSAEEVEKKVRQLMSDDQSLRERCLEMKANAMAAWDHGGSSFTAFSNLVASFTIL